MSILGVDAAVLGVEDMAAAARFYRDFGLSTVEAGTSGASFTTQDGSTITLREMTDAALPAAVTGGPTIRETVWGVSAPADVSRLADELAKDRNVSWMPDGSIRSVDDDGYGIGFRASRRKAFDPPAFTLNVFGREPARAVNQRVDFSRVVEPLTIGHIVFFTPDVARASRFYVERLGFRVSDVFRSGRGVFLRAGGASDHHSLFLIQSDVAKGLHHISFHVADFNEIMVAGKRLTKAGWDTQFGPGRHVIGSNCFWYFRSPCGGAMELAADMDRADDNWEVREWDFLPENVAAWSTTFAPTPVK